ncbi:nose resistant to fluoxetine protein 6-like [Schistocerca cancellata]|uniref:nose resistant to fluoxetine protein 6-like n=1 Tax=Schistocerca cancellata TaxID=274614 RepID=UPI0021181C5A|nr:nose resistant to fluoxetine protein 6-like [Schistocerca cancellata]
MGPRDHSIASELRETCSITVYDASVKAPWGVLSGSNHQLGHFDQCLSVSWHDLRGQYCLPSIKLKPLQPQPLPRDVHSSEFHQQQSAWLKIQFAGDPTKRHRDVVRWALCVPASCSPRQVEAALGAALLQAGRQLGVQLTAELQTEYCTVHEQQNGLPTSTILYLSCAAALIILVIVATVYDVTVCKEDVNKNEKHKGVLHKAMILFSAQNNMRKLLHVEKRKSLQGYSPLHVFLTFCVVSVHRYMDCYRYPIYNGEFIDMALHTPYFYVLSYGTVHINSFFARSGFHLAYCLSEEFEKSVEARKILLSIINRYLRLTPLYFMVILFYIYVLPYLGSGPLWKTTVIQEKENCEKYWWANILYINNYVGAKNMCILPTWYLSVDFQLQILGAILIYMKWRLPKRGWVVTGVVLVLSVVMSFSVLCQKQTDMFFTYTKEFHTDIRTDQVFQEVYISTLGRVPACFIGIVGGLIVYNQRAASFRLSKVSGPSVFIGVFYGCE